MTNHAKFQPVPVGAVSLRAFAFRSGVSQSTLERYCQQGRILGAIKHPLTRHWWIYPPAKLVLK
jgi:hypothetical protein